MKIPQNLNAKKILDPVKYLLVVYEIHNSSVASQLEDSKQTEEILVFAS